MEFKGVSVDVLLAPLSRHKVVVLLEVLDPVLVEQHDFFYLIGKGLGATSAMRVDWEAFCASGYLVAGVPLSRGNAVQAGQLIDFFRQAKLKQVVRASWYYDGQFIEHSGEGLSTYDLLTTIAGAGNFIIADVAPGFFGSTEA